MRDRLYKYSGLISCYSFDKFHGPTVDMVLYDIRDDAIAPTRIAAHGQIAAYIDSLSCTDDEERYITSDYYYDGNLYLAYISIPSSDPRIPAKIIAAPMSPHAAAWDFRIFGPSEHIETDKPEPMSHEEYCEWLAYKREMEIR